VIQATFRIVPPEEKRGELVEVLFCLKEPTEATHGCRGCEILQDLNDRRAIIWMEHWDSLAELQEHIRSERFRAMLPYIELSVIPPKVAVDRIDSLQGIDFLVNTLVSRPS